TWSCPIVVRTPYGSGIHGGPYHSQSIEAFYAHVPGLKVICVASPYDAKGLLKSAIRDPNPVVFLEHKKAYRAFRQEIPDGDYTIPIGQAETKREGSDISLITYGMMTHHSLKAAETLEQEDGTSVEVIDLRTVSPWDKERVLGSVKKTGKALILTMPEVGETVTEGTIERWLKKPGDKVEKYEPIVEINTDKVNVELPCPVSGTLTEILAQEGETILVGAELARLETAEGEV